ncbi:hypothetical protein V6N13_129551 [Hibiscus sabdariffa]|uniref:Uncharacterized protein n=1 Tax=Hibiscus sabdariffa TaxID=183260 RepID=A0ABR2SM52_9ROSI
MGKEVELDTHEERAGDGGTEGSDTSLDDKRERFGGVIRAVGDLEGGFSFSFSFNPLHSRLSHSHSVKLACEDRWPLTTSIRVGRRRAAAAAA